jgi:hypothetical protein
MSEGCLGIISQIHVFPKVQPVTCCDLSGFIYYFGAHSIDSSEMIRHPPKVLNFNWLFLKLESFTCD